MWFIPMWDICQGATMRGRDEKAMWLEILSLRAVGKAEKDAALALFRSVETSLAATRPSFHLFQNARLEYDLSLHLYWGSESGAVAESALGLRLAEALRSFGLVHHTVWIPERGQG
jgi:hypothetical protein